MVAYDFDGALYTIYITKHKLAMNTNLYKIITILLLSWATLTNISCNRNSPKSQYTQSSNILSKKELNQYIKDWVKENKTTFSWSVAPNKILYSALMQGDSLLTISYQLTPDGIPRPSPESRDNGKLPDEWIAKRDDIAQYILKEEQVYRKQPSLTLYDLLPYRRYEYSDDMIPILTIQVTSPNVVSELKKDKTIRALDTGYHPILWDF